MTHKRKHTKTQTNPKDSKSIAAAKWIGSYVSKPNIDTFSEVIVYSKEIAIAGTIDVLMMDKNSGDYVLIDWKTSKKIDKSSFNGKKGIKKEYFLPVIDHHLIFMIFHPSKQQNYVQ